MEEELPGSSGVSRSSEGPEITDYEKFRTGGGKPVVALDIDGTLADYHSHFLWFAERWLGMPMPDAKDVNPGMRLSTFMKVPHHVYRECKLAYRQGGLKRFMPVYSYASELTHNIRKAGAEVWLCTTRPYLRLDNIDPDTREWLRRNNIHYDAVIFESVFEELDYSYNKPEDLVRMPGNKNKYGDLVRQVGKKRVVAVVEDLPEQVSLALSNGILNIYLRDQPYNREVFWMANVKIVNDLCDLWSMLAQDIADWKDRNE